MDKQALAEVRELLTPTEEVVEDVAVDEVETEEVGQVVDDEVQDIEHEETAEDNDEESTDEAYTVSGLADAIGWEAADIYDVDVPMGDGQESVKLGDLKDKYQSTAQERDTLVSKVTEMEAKVTQAHGVGQIGNGVTQEVMQAMSTMEALKLRYNDVKWQEVEAEDPGGAALLRQKYQEAFSQAQGGITQAQGKAQAFQQEQLQQAATEMYRIIPEWNDQVVMKTEQDKIRVVGRDAGFSDDQINSINDPRLLKILREYVVLKDAQALTTAANKEAVKKVRKAPKVLKGSGRVKKDVGADIKRLKAAARNATTGNRKKAEMAAVKALLSNNG